MENVSSANTQNLTLETDPVKVQEIAREATIWAFPMVENYQSIYNLAIDPESSNYKGPMNQINNVGRVFTPEDTAIITPNADTPYSYLIMDLRAEPLVVTLPPIHPDRYYSLQLVDLYTFDFDYLGTRCEGNHGGAYLIAGPDWKGWGKKGKPETIKRAIVSETNLVFGQFRTQLFEPDDIERVKDIQSQYHVQTWSNFVATQPPEAPPEINYPPITREILNENFFKYVNFLLQFCPTHPSEVELRERLKTIGIEPGAVFPPDGVSQEWLSDINTSYEATRNEIYTEVSKLTTSLRMFGTRAELVENHGDSMYFIRAMGAAGGIYGNPDAETVYPIYNKDQYGDSFDTSTHNYTLKIPSGGLPAKSFWSVTMYNSDRFLVENPIDRYLINSPMWKDLKKDEDGGATLYLQYESPGTDKESNWLPAPNGPMSVAMRLYIPEDIVLSDEWQEPPIEITLAPRVAYEYSSPSLQTHGVLVATNDQEKSIQTNGFYHYTKLADHTFTGEVSPNNDTIYTCVLVDLRESPQIFTVPDTKDRYISVMMTDLRSYNFDVLVNQPGKYLFALKGYTGPVPKNVTLYETESDILYFVVRIGVENEEDLPNVHEIQNAMTIEPRNPVDDNHKPLDAPPETAHWVTKMQWILAHSPALDPADKEMADYINTLTPDDTNQQIAAQTHVELLKIGNNLPDTRGMYGKRENITVGQRTRAAANLYGHFALENERAAYPKMSKDSNGNDLIGSKRYTFTMPAESPVNPPHGFWSLTVYLLDTKQFVPNAEKLYRISDSTGVPNDDGTVTITLGGERGDAKNWLPLTNDNQKLYAMLRLYEGIPEVVDGTWEVPPIIETQL